MIKFDLDHRSFGLSYPQELGPLLSRLFAMHVDPFETSADEILHITSAKKETYSLHYKDTVLWENLTLKSLPAIICRELETLIASLSPNCVLRGGAVRAGSHGVLILGPAGSGKTMLTAWLARQNYPFLADNLLTLASEFSSLYDERNAFSPLSLPMRMHRDASALQLPDPCNVLHTTDEYTFLALPSIKHTAAPIEHAGLVLVPQFHENIALEVSPVSSAELNYILKQALHPAQRITPSISERIHSFARSVPAMQVRFGNFEQLEGQLDALINAFLSDERNHRNLVDFCANWQNPTSPEPEAIVPEPTLVASPAVTAARPKLTIGMATYDDFDGVYFSLQALRMYHPETVDQVEYIVIDNNPDGHCAKPLKDLQSNIPNYRYIPVTERQGTTVKDFVMQTATADFVLNIDCHVFLVPGAVSRLMHYFETHPDSNDLLQGPIVWDELDKCATHMDPVWDEGFWGKWAKVDKCLAPDAPPFEIPMHGMGLYACRRAAWPGFNSKFRGFGGEEGYIHEKIRQRGGRVMCLPFLGWLHRFPRPFGVPYKISWEDKIRNYLIGAAELGLPTDEIKQHFREILNKSAEPIIKAVEAEIAAGSLQNAAIYSRREAHRKSIDLPALGIYEDQRIT